MDLISSFILIIVAIVTIFYAYFKYSYTYWKSRGIPCEEPSIPFGNAKGLGATINPGHFIKNLYDKYKPTGAQMFGVYFFTSPTAVIMNLDLIKSILVRDFNFFDARGVYLNEEDDPLSAHLFSLNGEKWKKLRSKLTPTFTSGKMKFMFPTVVEVGDRFRNHLADAVQQNDELEMKDLCARFTTDVIGTCIFGIECNSLSDPNAEFRVYGRKVGAEPRHGPLALAFLESFRSIGPLLHIKRFADDVIHFYTKVARDTVDYREKNNINRNDFMDILIKLKNQPLNDKTDDPFTFNELLAQVFVFFLAGFETSSTTLTFCLYELALNPKIQSKARQIIRQAFQKYNGEFTYEMIMDMPYIDQIIHEALRKYPSLVNLNRIAKRNYIVPGTDFVIEKDTPILIPAYAIHMDPDYYPNPERFDPDRFSSDEKKKRDSMTWLPFGDGPRNCIGLRFGMMQTRIGLLAVLNNFELSIGAKMQSAPKFKPDSFTTVPQDGLYIKLKPVP